jgi:diguanylate cyclase (GGDEF)-like protein
LAAAKALLNDAYPSQMLMLAVLFAYGSGVVSRLAMRPRIASGALILTALPTIPALATHLTSPYLILSLAFVAFLVGGLVIVRRNYATLVEQLLTRHEFARLARYDHLTGLPNRLLLREHLDQALDAGGHRLVALHHVDLDRFKAVNDTHGHPMGDALLKQFGQRLQSLLRDGDIAARYGGDEFVVLQIGANNVDEVEFLARRIVKEAHTPFAIDGQLVRVGVSIGTALAPQHGSELEDMIAVADTALYRVKETGRDGFVIYGPDEPEQKLAI